jgi:hypothetical protein
VPISLQPITLETLAHRFVRAGWRSIFDGNGLHLFWDWDPNSPQMYLSAFHVYLDREGTYVLNGLDEDVVTAVNMNEPYVQFALREISGALSVHYEVEVEGDGYGDDTEESLYLSMIPERTQAQLNQIRDAVLGLNVGWILSPHRETDANYVFTRQCTRDTVIENLSIWRWGYPVLYSAEVNDTGEPTTPVMTPSLIQTFCTIYNLCGMYAEHERLIGDTQLPDVTATANGEPIEPTPVYDDVDGEIQPMSEIEPVSDNERLFRIPPPVPRMYDMNLVPYPPTVEDMRAALERLSGEHSWLSLNSPLAQSIEVESYPEIAPQIGSQLQYVEFPVYGSRATARVNGVEIPATNMTFQIEPADDNTYRGSVDITTDPNEAPMWAADVARPLFGVSNATLMTVDNIHHNQFDVNVQNIHTTSIGTFFLRRLFGLGAQDRD